MNVNPDKKYLLVFLMYALPVLGTLIVAADDTRRDLPFYKQHLAQALCYGVVSILFGSLLSSFFFVPIGLWLVGCYWGYQAYQGLPVTIPVITDFVRSQGWA